ncbi:right-handed parallel beta-helix repeat-containing protein [Sphingosinicella sp. LHD-64]|uniref:right-handed parallel beta-helix repeat-containing protein n=1 Tax=Sphingosinicella sp. LHD-64 TaxID=3072139 RepID=UPI00280D0F70|nr:right-handed parallel beta-helix repeat-containing protein [Sphingosinicella sp. LHD-64]MDQ8756340.1 right-handed parallel beta-helix repeat-containing protein [Sphingosinicella sp. LHD-64]
MDRRFLIALVLACLFVAIPSHGQVPPAPFTVQESGNGFATLAEAVAAIGDGSGTILIAPGRYRQCAVQNGGEIAYVAQQAGTVIFDGVACEGKAALVLDGRAARIEGLVFQNIRVPDMNGAGIRLETGDLTVRETMFRSGENGILVSNDHGGTIRIEHSTFSGLGGCPENAGCAHSIYNSGTGTLIVTRTRFERGTGGHYLKSRGRRIEVTESSFDDSQGQATNYMIDLSNGATGTIAGNTFVQGENKENYSALIMVAAEGAEHRSAGLSVTGNQADLAPGVDRRTAFVADASGDPITIANNRLGPQIARFEQR